MLRLFYLSILLTGLALSLSGCSSGSAAIDQFFETSLPVLNTQSNKVIAQTDLFKVDVNNIQDGEPGSDKDMSYKCYYDRISDGEVNPVDECTSIPLSDVSFNTTTGILEWTPSANSGNLGDYEIKIVGTANSGISFQIFNVSVRLKFGGLSLVQNITGVSADLSWTPNPNAVAYQVYTMNNITGLFELYQTFIGGSTSGGTVTSLVPSRAYTVKVVAVDNLGNPDSNTITSTFITTDLVKLSMSSSVASTSAGTSVLFTITAFNSDDTPQTLGGLALSAFISSGTTSGNFSTITDQNNGTYTFSFTPTTVGTSPTIEVSTSTTTFYLNNSITLNVTPGAAVAANSTLSSTSNSVVSGSIVTLTTQLRDQYNNPISSGIAVHFQHSGGVSTGNFGPVNNLGNGVYTTTFTGLTAGTATSISVFIDGNAFPLSTPITVTPGIASSITSTLVISQSTLPSGTDATITATLRDPNSNLISSGVLVTFNKSGGTSTGNFSSVTNAGSGIYTTQYNGLLAGSAQTISVSVDGSILTPTVSVTVVPGTPVWANSSLTLSADSVLSGSYITATALIRDLNNNPIESGITVTFSKTGGTSTGNFGAVTNQGAGQYNVRYTGVIAGTPQDLQIQIGGFDFGSPSQVTVVNSAPTMANSSIATSSSTVVSGSTVTITATLRDLNNNLISSGYTVTFSKTGGTSTGNFGAIVNNGNGTYSTTYTGVVAGSAQTISLLVDAIALGPTTTQTVIAGPPSSLLSTLIVSSNTVIAGSHVTLTATIKDLNGNPISSGHVISFDKMGGTSTGTYSAVVNQGNGVYTTTYTGHVAGTAQTVQVNVDLAGFGPTQTIQVLVGTPNLLNSSLTLSANTIPSSSNITITAVIRDLENNPITNQYTITMDAIGGSSTGTLAAVSNMGAGTFTSTYSGVNAGSAQTIRIFADGAQIVGLTDTISVTPGPVSAAQSTFTIANAASTTLQSTTAVTLAMNLRDANSNLISSVGTAVTFNKTLGGSDGTISAVTNLGSGNYSATYTGTTIGAAQTISLIVDGVNSGLSTTATVISGPPHNIFITSSPAGALNSIDCNGPYVITLQDANANTTVSLNTTTIGLSSAPLNSHVGTIFTDAGCLSAASSLTIPSLTSSTSFYYKSYRPQSITLTMSPDHGIASTNQTITNNPVLSWMGSSAYFTMNGSGSQTVYDDTSGGSYSPTDVLIHGNDMYVSDITVHRIIKYNISTNTMVGWIGHVGSVDGLTAYDGSGSCSGLNLGDLTPKWCLGGRSNMFTASLINSPRNLATDGTYLYVASQHRILRFLLSDGSFQGWYGKIASVTGMTPAVCALAGVGNTTPEWCYGGTHTSGALDGQFNTITGFTFLSGYLYVTDYSNQRIQRLNISGANPVFSGWIGNIATVAGMSPAACVTADVNAFTPQWCYGGTAKVANRYNLAVTPIELVAPNEGFYNPRGTATDGTYLYISDSNNYRIVRFNLVTETMDGWIGYIRASSATNPNVPVHATTRYTTTWTTGGIVASARNNTDGFNYINMLAVDTSVVPNILYFVDTNGHRLGQVQASDGQGSFKWIGRNSSSPVGGSTGCSSSAVGAVNPGWCLGGSAGRYGNSSGAFYNPMGIALTANKIYVTDQTNARVQRFDKITGLFDGWIGAGSATASTWSRSLAAGTIASRAGFDDYSFSEYTPNTSWYSGITGNANFLFQTDVGFHRIKKFNLLEGSIVGYVGIISGFGPTGPTDCVGYTSGFTPTWCQGGGRTTSGSAVHGYNNPFSIASDSQYAYVGSYSNNRIDRIRISDGLYMGWIGYVATSPTDGDGSCAGAPTTTYTPGWCIGGTAGSITTNNGFSNPRSVYYDSLANVLYTSDTSGRLIKLNPTDGSFIGVAAGVSTGTGCTITGNTAQGWCTSATGSSNSNYGAINAPAGIASNTNYIFVANMGNHRISRYEKTTGAPAGFIGQLTNVTNIDTASTTFTVNGLTTTNGCYNLTTGYPRATQGWCVGTSVGIAINTTTGSGDGMMNSPRGLWADDTSVYVSDFLNSRLLKFDATTGSFIGWRGYIVSDSGMTCASGTPVAGSVTPDWCTGGTSGPGKALGAFDSPSGLWGDTNYIYVMDTRNNRVVTVPK